MTSDVPTSDRGWRQLFSAAHREPVVVMAGGILLFAMNVYLTAALLPSAITDIGGRPLYGWTMTAFLVPAVASSLLVARAVRVHGARRAYQFGFGLFALGSIVGALAPSMPVLLAGRVIQGFAGGLLAGLGYAVIRQSLPEGLRSRALGLVSAMWGVGNLVGPTVGGVLAQVGAWRFAMVFLVVLSGGLAAVATRAMPSATGERTKERLPRAALALVSVAAAAVSVAGVVGGPVGLVLAVVAVGLLAAFVLRERTATTRILPAVTYARGNALKWIYLGAAVLAAVSTVEAFVPLFGQELGGMGPLLAGLLGASLSWGWSAASIWASSVEDDAGRARLRLVGPVLLTTGLAGYALLQTTDPAGLTVVAWFAALIVAGAGIGMAFQHAATAALAAGRDEAESTSAATGIPTVQLLANALGSAVAGGLVNLGGASTLRAADILLWTFAAVAIVAVALAVRANARLAGGRARRVRPVGSAA